MAERHDESRTATEREGGCVHTLDDAREVFVCTPFRAWQDRLAEKEEGDV